MLPFHSSTVHAENLFVALSCLFITFLDAMGHSDSFILVWRRDFDGLEAALQRAVYKLSEKQLARITDLPTLLIGAAKSNIKEDVARDCGGHPGCFIVLAQGCDTFSE